MICGLIPKQSGFLNNQLEESSSMGLKKISKTVKRLKFPDKAANRMGSCLYCSKLSMELAEITGKIRCEKSHKVFENT